MATGGILAEFAAELIGNDYGVVMVGVMDPWVVDPARVEALGYAMLPPTERLNSSLLFTNSRRTFYRFTTSLIRIKSLSNIKLLE